MIFNRCVTKLLLKKTCHAIGKPQVWVRLYFKNFVIEILKVNNRHRFGLDQVPHREMIVRLLSDKSQI